MAPRPLKVRHDDGGRVRQIFSIPGRRGTGHHAGNAVGLAGDGAGQEQSSRRSRFSCRPRFCAILSYLCRTPIGKEPFTAQCARGFHRLDHCRRRVTSAVVRGGPVVGVARLRRRDLLLLFPRLSPIVLILGGGCIAAGLAVTPVGLDMRARPIISGAECLQMAFASWCSM
jgi:hypothetical protein